MYEKLTLELHNRAQAWAAIKSQLYPFLAAVLQAGGRWVLTVDRRKRTKAQNMRYWGNGVLKQIADQATVNGKRYSAETWHELAKRKFIGVIELPDGQCIGMSSAALSTVEFCEFCDKVEAWAASELGVTFYDLRGHR
jgi:hypothetical protein